MELSVNSRQRRAAQIGRNTPQTETKPAAPGGGTAGRSAKTDKTSWSQTALSFLQEVNRQDLEKQRKLLEAKQRKNGELDFLSKSLKTMEKCRKIASRIMKGDKVPPQDERYLKDNDPDGYKLALVSRKPKKNPKEWESVLDEEDRMGGSESGGETATAAEPGGEGME